MIHLSDSYFIPVLVPVALVAVLVVAGLLWRRRSMKGKHGEIYATFLPPIIGPKVPKGGQHYVVPLGWKPMNGVYQPLSIPLQDMSQKNSRVAVIHALPPHQDDMKNASPDFV